MIELERIRQARQTNLVKWLRLNNEPLKQAGQWWYIEGNDSLRIQGNKWYRNSQDRGGNTIDFLVDYYCLSPKEAIERLTQSSGHNADRKCGVKEKNKNMLSHIPGSFDFNSISLAGDQRRVIAYLSKTRGIPAAIVLHEIKKGQLLQEAQTANAIFVMTNEDGDIVGVEITGTLSFQNIRFRGLKPGSDTSYAYNVGQRRAPRFILYFESAIDLLSFITIRRDQAKMLDTCLLMSMAGLKIAVVKKTLSVFGKSLALPVLCVDNDKAGNDFIHKCLNLYPSTIIEHPDKNYKDWNDQLRGRDCLL